MVSHLGLPQIRTCGTTAYGSSVHGLAAPASLPGGVSLRWLTSPMSRSSFPPPVPCSGPAFPPQGPAGQFPRFSGTTRCSDSPPPIPSCFVAFAQRYRSRFLFRSRGGRNRPAGAWAWSPGARPGSLRRRRGLPGSWTSPLRTCSAPGRLRPNGPNNGRSSNTRICRVLCPAWFLAANDFKKKTCTVFAKLSSDCDTVGGGAGG